ncbi:hypothetical protein EUX98_g4704 [Antrodiella citrinella]|uniref:Uncharacterized protein n=1 Tax=Antrodiella citrinella TaxID=2447956 RepID=A0A4S4MV64_9APHY|nr:hypothetical protein EUX98_g4704 [Antrodiella citrinella]
MIDFPSPILSVASDVISELDGEDAVYGLWTVFTKCKRSLKDGRRLENISWRLWYREMSNSHSSPPQSPGSTSPALSDFQAYCPITPISEDGPNGNLDAASRDSLLHISDAHTAHSWHGQSLAPSATNVSRRLSTASMPARPLPKAASRAGKIIIEILPDTLVVPPRRNLNLKECKPTSSGTTSAVIPTVVANPHPSNVPLQRPVISVPSNATSPSTSLGFPSVVVVNPTPHPTPPATPQALRPVSGAPTFATHLLPPPARRPMLTARQSPEPSVLSDAQALAPPATGSPAPNLAAALQPQPPSKQSESPDERSPDAESPLASTSKLSDTQSPSSEASSRMKSNVGPGVARRAATLGKARARKSKETVRHGAMRPMTSRAQTQRQAPAVVQRKASAEPKKAAFNIGSTSSNGSRGTVATSNCKQSQENSRVRAPSPAARITRSTSQPVPPPAVNGKVHASGNGNGNACPPSNRRGIVVSESDYETTESDDDSEWASEGSPDEQELARRREETRLREAAEEAQRQRDMFAKVPKRSYTDLSRTRSGLLSQLLNPDPALFPPGHPMPTSFSSQDMTQLSRSGWMGAPHLHTSKSTVAVPLAAQVNADQITAPTQSGSKSGYRPKGRPQGEEMEYDSDSGDETGDNGIQVPRSLAQQKLAALADPNRRRYSDRGPPPAQEAAPRPVLPTVATAPIALGYPYNLPAPAAPMTPRTTRRQMLSTELSESLRRNLLWERQVSKVNMTSGARRGGLLSGGLRPLTAVTTQEPARMSSHECNPHNQTQTPPGRTGVHEKEDRRRAAMARNKSWADDYHTSGW